MNITQDQLNQAFNNYIFDEDYYLSDCQRICEVAAKNGLVLSLSQAKQIWESWSDSTAAGWLIIQDDNDIELAIESFVNKSI